jgi:2-C-methyl-D-erythritol 4-phosphate cytidylyltransferase
LVSTARVGVVITAAGSGSRLGYGAPKALVPLSADGLIGDDSSLFVVALRQVAGIAGVTHVVVTAPADQVEVFTARTAQVELGIPVGIVPGADTRQASVFAGLKALAAQGFGSEPEDVVLVHDAARAMAGSAMMDRVVAAVIAGSAAVIPALPVSDTLKLVDVGAERDESGRERIVGSADRSAMRSVQTPQGFPWRVLWQAHVDLADRGLDEMTAATDDSTIAQWAGHEVDCVVGDELALKITTPTDLTVARVLYAQTLCSAHTGSPYKSLQEDEQ